MLLEGLFVPLTTPFYLDGRLNLRKLEHNVDRYSRTPAAGMAVLSEWGDSSLLTDEEAREALGAAIALAGREKVMLAGVSRNSVFATVELAIHAASLGYDAVLVGPPSLFRKDGEEKRLLGYFQAVADQSPLPVVLASSIAGPIATELVLSLAAHPNVFGLVDAQETAGRIAAIRAGSSSVAHEVTVSTVFTAVTGRMLAERSTSGGATFITADSLTDGATALAVAPPLAELKTRSKTVGFQILSASTGSFLSALGEGAVGGMLPFSACAPQACYEVLAAWKDRDDALAQEKQERLAIVAKEIELRLGSAGVRYGCDLNGYFGGRPRLPLLPVTGEEKTQMELLMQSIRN